MKKEEIFNEQTLRDEIAKTWGEHGAHIEVYDGLINKVKRLLREIEIMQGYTEATFSRSEVSDEEIEKGAREFFPLMDMVNRKQRQAYILGATSMRSLLGAGDKEAIAFAEWVVENEWKKNWRADKSEYQWQQFSLHSNPKRDYKTTAELFAIWKETLTAPQGHKK